MAVGGASKLALTPPAEHGEPSCVVLRTAGLLGLIVSLLSVRAGAQAPDAAELWRVAAGSLALPAALSTGATAGFWNPASGDGRIGASVGVEVVHTSSILGLSGLMVGGTLPVSRSLRIGILAGRMQVRDLVRTTTSPDSEAGSIPVYEQLGGAQAVLGSGWLRIGAVLAVHHARFDVESETGATLDVGVRAQPIDRFTVAAATHFLPITLGREPSTDYYGAVEYVALDRLALADLRTRLAVRYGATLRPTGDLEHLVGVAVAVNDEVLVDAALTSESAYGHRDLRPSVAVGLRIGRYTIVLSHGAGINDVGGTFRVGLDVGFRR